MAVKTVRVNFMMAEENLKQVDAACRRLGINRTAFINFACNWFLREEIKYFTEDNFGSFVNAARQMRDDGLMECEADSN